MGKALQGDIYKAAGLAALVLALSVGGAVAAHAAKSESGGSATTTGSYLAAFHAEYIGDSTAAADFLGHVLAADAGNATVRRRAFIHLVSSGRVEQAVPLAEKIKSGGRTAALATITLSTVAARTGDLETADALLAAPLPGNFGEVIAPMLRAWIRQGLSDLDGAIEMLAPLEEDDGLKLFRDIQAALIYDLAGQPEKAETAYAKAMVGGDSPALRLVEAYVSFLARAGKFDEARAILDAVPANQRSVVSYIAARANLERGREARRFVETSNQGLAQALFEVAVELRGENAPNVALFLAQLAVYVDPDLAIGHVLIAEILDDQGQVEAAVDSYHRVSDDSPLGWQVRVRRAELLSDLDKSDEAIALLEAMAAEREDQAEPLIRMGHILRGEERFEEAVVAYDRAAARIQDLQPRHWFLLYTRGIALERSKNWPRAETDFLKALEFEPDQPFVLNYLGYSWVDKGVHLERARAMIERAVELRPRDGYIVDSLGWALYRLGDFEGAVGHLERAIELRPEDPVINDHLGDAYWRVGRLREARFQWTRSLSLEPEEDQVDLIRAKIRDGLAPGDGSERDS
jgi:tetratricopeptide (TPR) repeat protein